MRIGEAMTLALREFADAQCRHCSGRGMRGGSGAGDLCACVRARLEGAEAPAPAEDDMPHPWPIITRRAQQIHAAATVDAVPDVWG